MLQGPDTYLLVKRIKNSISFDKNCRAAYVDKHLKVVLRNEVGDNSCQSQYHK